ncbi:hypothetical protein Y032_0023g873 [Ancylostoma ceylanicum]|uniref:Uncharacterized protein n=1 Tax=Ancylostoma ceylanicum TaxID=53326 RepID=A0A016UXI5_9BILA|nr:hypothetical protein Y032_0023g873 [Ancylostoma ceylanicum]
MVNEHRAVPTDGEGWLQMSNWELEMIRKLMFICYVPYIVMVTFLRIKSGEIQAGWSSFNRYQSYLITEESLRGSRGVYTYPV